MIRVEREEFLTDPSYVKMYELIRAKHEAASHTKKLLLKNRHIKNFCALSEHFVQIPAGETPIYLSYDVSSWLKEPIGIQIKIDTITFYDNEYEFKIAQMKGLNSSPNANDPQRN